MNPVYDDRFVIFVRADRRPEQAFGEATEHALATCASYAEARAICRRLPGGPGDFVIRYIGQAGGGD
jgi:hypothetical protein